MYAVVKTGGKQYKVAVGDVLEIEKLEVASGDEVTLPVILVVDGAAVTHEADQLAKLAVTAEIVAHTKGPKIRIHKFKNKTGYHQRMGHRQKLTQVKVTGIGPDSGEPKAKAETAPATATKAAPAKKAPAKAAKAPAKTPAKAATKAAAKTAAPSTPADDES